MVLTPDELSGIEAITQLGAQLQAHHDTGANAAQAGYTMGGEEALDASED